MKYPQLHSSQMKRESLLSIEPENQQYKYSANIMLVDDEEDLLITYRSFLEVKTTRLNRLQILRQH